LADDSIINFQPDRPPPHTGGSPAFLDAIDKLLHFVSRHRAVTDVLHDAMISHDRIEAIDVRLAVWNEPEA
jgi:hypothetical protein